MERDFSETQEGILKAIDETARENQSSGYSEYSGEYQEYMNFGERMMVIVLLLFSFAMIFFMGYGVYKVINKPIPGQTTYEYYNLTNYSDESNALVFINSDGVISCRYVDATGEVVSVEMPAGTPVQGIPGVEPYIEITTTPVEGRYWHKRVTTVTTYHIMLDPNNWAVESAQ